jgi:phosphohistidine phosphatase
MKRLYLLRHAKSSWDDPLLADRDRPLAKRGRRAGAAIAGHMEEQGIEPELVLCSTARRARETLELVAPALGGAAVAFEDELYAASAGGLLDRLRRVPDDVTSVLLIAHNPGMQQLLLRLARPGPELAAVAQKFPTAALATLTFAGDRWSRLDSETSELVDVVRPRDLG